VIDVYARAAAVNDLPALEDWVSTCDSLQLSLIDALSSGRSYIDQSLLICCCCGRRVGVACAVRRPPLQATYEARRRPDV